MLKTQNWRKRKFGFTLIELLVVISIIALLMAILVPALAMAKDAARTVVCLSNEKPHSLAMFSYINDWDGYFAKSFTAFHRHGFDRLSVYERLEP